MVEEFCYVSGWGGHFSIPKLECEDSGCILHGIVIVLGGGFLWVGCCAYTLVFIGSGFICFRWVFVWFWLDLAGALVAGLAVALEVEGVGGW